MHNRRTVLILLTSLLLLSACRGRGTRPVCPIRIGIITSLTGRYQGAGTEQLRGYTLALREINAGGGILGCKVELVIENDMSGPREAQLAVDKLVNEARVPLIIGSYSSGATVPACGVANAYKIPIIVPSASSELVTSQGYDWVFRINATSKAYAETAIAFVEDIKHQLRTDVPTLAIVYEATLFGESAAAAAATTAAERGLPVVAYESYNSANQNYAPLLTRLKAEAPDILYLAANSPDDAAAIMAACRAVDLNAKLYIANAGGFINPDFITQAGRNAEYVIVTSQWAPDIRNPQWTGIPQFAQKFQQAYGVMPQMRSAQTYAALYVAKDAIERAAREASPPLNWVDHREEEIRRIRLAVRDALASTDIPASLFGPISFDDSGQNAHPVILVQVIHGEFATIYPSAYQVLTPIVPTPHWGVR